MFSLPIRVDPLQGKTRFIKRAWHTARSAFQLAAPRGSQLMMGGIAARTFARKNKSPPEGAFAEPTPHNQPRLIRSRLHDPRYTNGVA